MTTRVITITPERSVADAAQLMLAHRVSGLPVMSNDGRLIGIVSEHDLLRRRKNHGKPERPHWLQLMTGPADIAEEPERFLALTVGEVMTPEVVTIRDTAPLDEAEALIEQHRIKRLPVVHDQSLVGVISRSDLVRALPHAIRTAAAAQRRARAPEPRVVELERQYWMQRSRLFK